MAEQKPPTTHSRYRRLQPLPLQEVTIEDEFWAPRCKINREVTLNQQLKQCEETGRIANFDKAAGRAKGNFEGILFNDSDLYKWLEAASYTLATHPDDPLERKVDEVIERIGAAQQEDGYLNTYFQLKEPDKKWTNLGMMHELYCAGHLFQAATAHYEATGKTSLLTIACRFADHIDGVFGPGKRNGMPGHEEIELALVQLYRVKGEKRYLRLAQFFIDQRGRRPSVFAQEINDPNTGGRVEAGRHHLLQNGRYSGRYVQDHRPVREQDAAVGHAVRATYLYSAMADIVGETGEQALRDALERLWANLTLRRMYVTGGIGSSRDNEGFTKDYHLPNLTAYAETCAAAGHIFWNHRMLQLDGEARFADIMELTLYNGLLAGVSLDGQHYFYVNPLRSLGNHTRQAWFGCACCPPNIARLLASLGHYIYSRSDDGLWVHLYVSGSVQATTPNGASLKLTQNTRYPWDGEVKIRVHLERPERFSVYLHIPGWCQGGRAAINQKISPAPLRAASYYQIERTWQPGDTITLSLPMPIQRLEAHPAVTNNIGHVTLRRGPLIYCLEEVDHPVSVHAIQLAREAPLKAAFKPDLLGGIGILQGEALAKDSSEWKGLLYRPLTPAIPRPVALTAIPYYAWNNRGPGEMTVWIKTA